MSLKILSSKEFENEIKKVMREKFPIPMLDAIVLFCAEKNIEIETAASLVTPKMKAVLESDAIKTKMIATKSAKLPI